MGGIPLRLLCQYGGGETDSDKNYAQRIHFTLAQLMVVGSLIFIGQTWLFFFYCSVFTIFAYFSV